MLKLLSLSMSVLASSPITDMLNADVEQGTRNTNDTSMVVTLVGYRGSGKSTVAAALASRLGWGWVDADHGIECRAGRTIRDVFARDGEPAFRLMEREVLADLLSRDELVVAAGGGAVLDADTRRRMKAAGPVVWLQASVETLERRIVGDATTAERRPNLTAGGGRAEIETLLARREPLYREVADVTVDTDGRDADSLADEIARAVRPWLAGGPTP
jgi:shikimate kinase